MGREDGRVGDLTGDGVEREGRTGRLVEVEHVVRVPAVASNDPAMRGRPQLSSMNRMIDDWSVSVWSTKLALANGEITSSGRRGP